MRPTLHLGHIDSDRPIREPSSLDQNVEDRTGDLFGGLTGEFCLLFCSMRLSVAGISVGWRPRCRCDAFGVQISLVMKLTSELVTC